jgi:hypothetical protein
VLRQWFFRVLVLLSAGAMLYSAILPWWSADVQLVVTPASGLEGFKVVLYQHGIPTTAGAEYFQTDVTPGNQVNIAWAYIGVSMGLLVLGSFLRGRKGKWIIGGTGAMYIIYALVALFWISRRAIVYNVPIAGHTVLVAQNGEIVDTGFHLGYWLVFASGLMSLALATFRDKITGKTKT